MKKQSLKIALAISGVIFGVSLFLFLMIKLAAFLNITDLNLLVPRIPKMVLTFIGAMQVITFLPIFLSGVYFLKPRGAIGDSPHLVTRGIYQYLRNPFYSGLSFTLTGVGLLLNQTGIFLAGCLWLTICYFQCRREERQLLARFGHEYREYKQRTPMFMPRFQLLLSALFNR